MGNFHEKSLVRTGYICLITITFLALLICCRTTERTVINSEVNYQLKTSYYLMKREI